MLGEAPRVRHGGAAFPAGREVGGPPGAAEPVDQVVDVRVGDRDLVRSDVHGDAFPSEVVSGRVKPPSARRGVLNRDDTQTGSSRLLRLTRRVPREPLEVAREVGLVGVAEGVGDVGDRVAVLEPGDGLAGARDLADVREGSSRWRA